MFRSVKDILEIRAAVKEDQRAVIIDVVDDNSEDRQPFGCGSPNVSGSRAFAIFTFQCSLSVNKEHVGTFRVLASPIYARR
jgi:hypothetical protein